ncbi:MAG: hypothetical protein ACRDE2_07520, partial [Chitinophagaceae bacterium]
MKTYSTILLIGALALAIGGCSTAYQAQTPDAVYYSPSQNNSRYASSSNSNSSQEAVTDDTNPNSGNYVTYENGYNEDNSGSYSYLNNYSGYNTQALNLFDNPYNSYAYNSFMIGSPMFYSPLSMGFGLGLSPYYGIYPSLGLGLGLSPYYGLYPSFGMGYPFGMMGGLYSPYAMGGFYSPYYYPSYMMGYGYYGGGYGYGKLGTYTPRPASAYGPRGSVNSRTYLGAGEGTLTNGSAPIRTFGNTSPRNVQNNTIYGRTPERVFTTNPNEHPENLNTNTRVEEKRPSIFRVFQRNNNNNYVEPKQSNQETFRPQQERTYYRPERTFESTPRVETSTPSFNNSGSAPVRT